MFEPRYPSWVLRPLPAIKGDNQAMLSLLNLQASVESLYRTFAQYPLPDDTNPCICCHSVEDEAPLHSKPLRELEAADLEKYAFDALFVWGDIPEFKHFLPRIFDLMFELRVNIEILFAKFRHGEWRTWPLEEQQAVEAFLQAVWFAVLADTPHIREHEDIEAWLCAIAQAEDDLAPYLSKWIEDDSAPACSALCALILESAIALERKTGRNAFWDKRDDQYMALQRWVYSTQVREKLSRALTDSQDLVAMDDLEAAIRMLT